MPFLKKIQFSLIDHILERNRLGVLDIGGLARRQALIERILHLFRALFGANATSDAFFRIHIARPFSNRYGKIAGLAFHLLHIRHRQQSDVEVAPAFDELRGKNAHRAVVGGKGFVQLSHGPADGGRTLDDVDEEP